MPFKHAHNFTIEHTTFNEIHGNSYHGMIAARERGMVSELYDLNPLISPRNGYSLQTYLP